MRRCGAPCHNRGRHRDGEDRGNDDHRPAGADIRGAVTCEPDPAGTRLHWSWELRPHGVMRLFGPLVAAVGRKQEAENWAALKRYLEDSSWPDH